MTILDDFASKLLLVAEFYLHPLDQQHALLDLRRRHCVRMQSASGFLEARRPEPLPEVRAEEATPEVFLKMTDRLRRPLVVRGYAKDAKATRLWSLNYFEEQFGSSSYPVVADSGAEDPITKRTRFEKISVREMVEYIRAGEGHRYIANLTRIFTDHPTLIDDMEIGRLPRLWGGAEGPECFDAINMFMGGHGTGSNMHCAFASNFFNNIVGRKRWVFIDPQYSNYLLPMPSRPFIYSDVLFDPGDDELGRFTRLLPSYEVVLEPGDVLYNAPWWWHRVENVDDFTVGCAVRYSNLPADLSNNLLFTLLCQEHKLQLLKLRFRAKKAIFGDHRIFRDVLNEKLDSKIYEAS